MDDAIVSMCPLTSKSYVENLMSNLVVEEDGPLGGT